MTLLWWRNLKEPFLWTFKCPEWGLFGFWKKWRVSGERASTRDSLAKLKILTRCSPLARETQNWKALLATRSRSGFFEFFRTLATSAYQMKFRCRQKEGLLLEQGSKFALRIRFIAKNCESEANSLRFASQNTSVCSLRFRFAIITTNSQNCEFAELRKIAKAKSF